MDINIVLHGMSDPFSYTILIRQLPIFLIKNMIWTIHYNDFNEHLNSGPMKNLLPVSYEWGTRSPFSQIGLYRSFYKNM